MHVLTCTRDTVCSRLSHRRQSRLTARSRLPGAGYPGRRRGAGCALQLANSTNTTNYACRGSPPLRDLGARAPPRLARGTRLARRPPGLWHSASCRPAAAPRRPGNASFARRERGYPPHPPRPPPSAPPAAARPRPTGRTGTRGRGMGEAGAAAPPSVGGGRLAAGARLPAPQPMRAAGRG